MTRHNARGADAPRARIHTSPAVTRHLASGPRLDALAVEIRAEVEQAEADFRSAVAHAIRAGELLIEAKSQVRHGEWLPWLAANCAVGVHEARNYMRLARNRERVLDLPSIREAVALLAEHSEPPATGPSPELADYCQRMREAGLEVDVDLKLVEVDALIDGDGRLGEIRQALYDLERLVAATISSESVLPTLERRWKEADSIERRTGLSCAMGVTRRIEARIGQLLNGGAL